MISTEEYKKADAQPELYTDCYKMVAIIGVECIQIEPLVYNELYKVRCDLNSNKTLNY